MRLGKASAYAILAAAYIARNNGSEPVQGRVIAKAFDIPTEYLLKVLQVLVQADVLDSESGRRGGYLLRKSPERTTLLELIEAVEGPIESGIMADAGNREAADLHRLIEALCEDAAGYTRMILSRTTLREFAQAVAV